MSAQVDLAQVVDDLHQLANGNVGDGIWELHDKYAAMLEADA